MMPTRQRPLGERLLRPERLLTAMLLLFAAAYASATTVEYLPIDELTARSELVFLGRVQEIQVRPEARRIVTDFTFEVELTLKGQKVSTFVLHQLGGTDGVRTQRVPGYPRFTVGERVVLFVEATSGGGQVVTGLAQGKFAVVETGGVQVATRDLSDLTFVRPWTKPDVVLPNAPANLNQLPLVTLVALVRGEPLPVVPIKLSIERTPQVVPLEVAP